MFRRDVPADERYPDDDDARTDRIMSALLAVFLLVAGAVAWRVWG